ncbi:putative RNA-directed DNA polymerase [Helianthus annuus]|nr:putative RNA-directed DNA polymerase [Helianthus annuus]
MINWPHAKLTALNKFLSDHSPLCLACDEVDFGPVPLRLYNSWLDAPGFGELVSMALQNTKKANQADQKLCGILRDLKNKIKQWRINEKEREDGILKEAVSTLNELELKAIARPLSKTENDKRVYWRLHIRDSESKRLEDMKQKAKSDWVKLGDENSAFFHRVIAIRRARNKIGALIFNGVPVTNPKILKKKVKAAFSKKFKETNFNRPSLSSEGFSKIGQETVEDLVAPFNLDEIKRAVWGCGGDKAPGPDGFSFKFIKRFWNLLSPFFADVLYQFHDKEFINEGCNSSFVALLPKVVDPQDLNDFRPISLIGVVYKVIAKVLANRIKPTLPSIVSPVQSAFVEGRYILDGPLMVSEIISWAKKVKKELFIFKADFQKAYDSVSWNFLKSNLHAMGFPKKWRKWIGACLKSSRASVLLNGSPTDEFTITKGLRQGDPLSPFLFVLVLEALSIVMKRAVDVGLFRGVKLLKDGPVLSHFCYADDVIFIGEWDMDNVKNLNRILRCFSLSSGLKINLSKSCLLGIGVDENRVIDMADVVKCKSGKLPFTYLGVPIGENMKKVKAWKSIIDRFNSRLSGWKANSLSFAGRVTLAKAVLGALPNYYLSMFKAPIKVVRTLEGIRRDFVWGKKSGKYKVRWVAWKKIIAPKCKGGIGVGDIRGSNLALLAKWWWKLKENPSALWVQVIKAIHTSSRNIQVLPIKKNIVGIWKDICSISKECYAVNVELEEKLFAKVGRGDKIMFWIDNWLEGGPLRYQFPNLYDLAQNRLVLVSECYTRDGNAITWSIAWKTNPSNLSLFNQLNAMLRLLDTVIISDQHDRWVWNNARGEDLSVALIRDQIAKAGNNSIDVIWPLWNNWAPLKINYFLWRASLNRIPVKTQLLLRGVRLVDTTCARCGQNEEYMDHVLASCLLAHTVWWHVLVWIKIPIPQEDFSFIMVWNLLQNLMGSKEWKKLVSVIFMATFWQIWKARNAKEFEGWNVPVLKVVEEIKLNSFLSITCRTKFKALNWDRWLDFNIRDVIV